MIPRRTVLSGAFAGTLAPVAAGARTSRDQSVDRETAERLVYALRDILNEMQEHRNTSLMNTSSAVQSLRDVMKVHLRSHLKFPAYVDVGFQIWMGVYDWHVATRQPLAVSRLADGRYTIALMQSTIVLRPEVEDTYISTPYDVMEGARQAGPGGVRP